GESMKAFLASILVVFFASSVFADQKNPNVKCGPNSDGGELVWLNTQAHQIWLNKEDNLDKALTLTTKSWQSNSEFSISAAATFQNMETYNFDIHPKDDNVILTMSFIPPGGKAVKLKPVNCHAL